MTTTTQNSTEETTTRSFATSKPHVRCGAITVATTTGSKSFTVEGVFLDSREHGRCQLTGGRLIVPCAGCGVRVFAAEV